MITVQETTVWAEDFPNHKYIMSDDMRYAYGYIKVGEKFPQLFTKPLEMSWRGRTYKVLVRTRDKTDTWYVKGSRGAVYTVALRDGNYTCSCPAGRFRGSCKHTAKFTG